ncbi:MAG: oxidoreductase [Sphingobacteriia bacterium]|nr:oxidoreductase [Sphingobacteriia bacterium]
MNRLIKIFSYLILCLYSGRIAAQQPSVQVLEKGRKTSIRGMCVVSDQLIWVSGSAGSVGKSADSGKTWNWITVPNHADRDFRDIEAFDENTALIMAVGEPAVILKTKDGGRHWYTVYEDDTKGVFLDAMDFIPSDSGYTGAVIGDPIDHKLYYLITDDAGETWIKTNRDAGADEIPYFGESEGFFASSGTNIQFANWGAGGQVFFVSGGAASRLFCTFYCQRVVSIPILQGTNSTGANSIALAPVPGRAVIVGGDYAKDSSSAGNCVLVNIDEQKGSFSFNHPKTNPHGYRSCVIYINEHLLIACGTSGVDISSDGGNNWQLITTEGFHVVQKAKQGNAVFLAGKDGRIARLMQ